MVAKIPELNLLIYISVHAIYLHHSEIPELWHIFSEFIDYLQVVLALHLLTKHEQQQILHFYSVQCGIYVTNWTNKIHTHYNALIYKTPTCFQPHWPIIRECSHTKQLLSHTNISNIWSNGEIINIWLTVEDTYTIIWAAYMLECAHTVRPKTHSFEKLKH